MTDCQLLLDAIPLPVLRLPPTTMFTSMTDCCNSNTYPHLSFLVGCNSNNTRITRITITGTQPQPAWTLSPNIGKLNALTSLVISNVGLSGDLPDAFSDMPELEDINFSKGNLTGPFPSSFSRLTNLQTLRMDENAITGPLPPVWGQALKRLSLLSLQQNKIAGGIPTEWSGLTSLRSLDLSKNFLKDSITPLANLTSLTSIVLSVNSFEGTLSSFIPMKKLSNLQVSFNLLTGAIPTLGDGSSSFYLFVDNNFLRGRIPDFVYDLNNVRLTQNCFLNGDIDRSRFKVKSNRYIFSYKPKLTLIAL
ncbi:hypothetical protein BC829DRAFT_388789 [Chytridium lagenaria]|nr:hypothetical protein BC829DRAFT_388789 [Chytridium lagenaria]